MVARTPSTTSAYVIMRSEAEIEDRLVERCNVEPLHCREQLLVRTAGEESVQGSLEVGDVHFEQGVQAHVLEAPRVQTLLLAGQVREVLRRNRRPPRIVVLPHVRRRWLLWHAPLREPSQRPDLHQRLFRTERAEPIRRGAPVHRQAKPWREA